jgi:peptide deformylase
MKTAMQELIDKIQYSIDVQSGVSLTETQVNTLKTVMLIAETLLEKEKEQIIEAWYNGGTNGMGLFETNTGEEYYNKNYKTKDR